MLKINLLPRDSGDPEIMPYWNDSVARNSALLWQPMAFEVNKHELKTGSWFSISSSLFSEDHKKELAPIVTVPESVVRSRKFRFYPTADQRQTLRKWFGDSRFTYNRTLSQLKEPGSKASWFGIKTPIMQGLPEWANASPYQVLSVAIRDCCLAVKAAKKKFRETGEFQEVKFKSRKKDQCIFIPKSAVKQTGVYLTMLGELFFAEKIPKAEQDCRLVLQKGRYFLIVPTKIQVQASENQAGICALDPGLRTFLTLYNGTRVEKIGTASFSRIIRLCHALDTLIGCLAKASGARKRRIGKAAGRLRNRIADSISELHHKVAAKLTSEYKVVIIPEFNFHPMSGNLFRKTVRGLATLAHGRFRQILVSHAEKRNCKIVFQNEAYTSKTCSSCGYIQEIGAKPIWKCKSCSHEHDRDANGARGIFLRALRDTSWLQELFLATCISGA